MAVDMTRDGQAADRNVGQDSGDAQGNARDREEEGYMRAMGLSTGWAVFSYLIAGMLAYGAIGWLVARATHIAILFPVGMLVGLAISLAYVIHHYGRAETIAEGKAEAKAKAETRAKTQKARKAGGERANLRKELTGDR